MALTKTQLQIAQELVRRGWQPMVTLQDECLKFQTSYGSYPVEILWVGRRGDLWIGRRLTGSSRHYWPSLRRAAKENYVEEEKKEKK